jgi:hypothetical protein
MDKLIAVSQINETKGREAGYQGSQNKYVSKGRLKNKATEASMQGEKEPVFNDYSVK